MITARSFHYLWMIHRLVAFAALVIACPAQPTYRYESLAGKSDAEIDAFMGGKTGTAAQSPDPFAPGIVLRTFPAWIWEMEPEAAARKCLDAIPASRNSDLPTPFVRPPGSGWIVVEETTSTCFTAGGSLVALRYGIDEPFLVRIGSRSMPDPSAGTLNVVHRAANIPLSREEATRIAAIAYWLARLDPDFKRSATRPAHWDHLYLARVDFLDPGGVDPSPEITLPRLTPPWRREGWLDGSAYGGRIHLFFTEALPARLGDRWTGPADRASLLAAGTKILEWNRATPVPAALLCRLIEVAGDAPLAELREPFGELSKRLAQPGAGEVELERLRKQIDETAFNSPFDEVTMDPEMLRRAMELGEKFRFDPPFQVRPHLALALRNFDALQDSAALGKLADDNGPFSWAERMLVDRYPEEHARHLTRQFNKSEADRYYYYRRLIETNPLAASTLRDSMAPKLQAEFIILNAELDVILHPDQPSPRFEPLFHVLQGGSDRADALRILSKMRLSADQASRLESALLAELRGETILPETADSIIAAAVEFLVSRPDPDRFWEPLLAASHKIPVYTEAAAFRLALAKLAVSNPDRRMLGYQQWIASALKRGPYPVDELLDTILALDLRDLSEMVAALATASPEAQDGQDAREARGGMVYTYPQRYHRARQITALWNETDPDTLATMWTGLVKSADDSFSPDNIISARLRTRCGEALGKASEKKRLELVADLRKIENPRPAFTEWIKNPDKASR